MKFIGMDSIENPKASREALSRKWNRMSPILVSRWNVDGKSNFLKVAFIMTTDGHISRRHLRFRNSPLWSRNERDDAV